MWNHTSLLVQSTTLQGWELSHYRCSWWWEIKTIKHFIFMHFRKDTGRLIVRTCFITTKMTLHFYIIISWIKKAVDLRGSRFRNETEKHFSEISISGCSFAWPQTGTYSTARLHLKDKSMSKGRKYNTSKTWHVAVYKDGGIHKPSSVAEWTSSALRTDCDTDSAPVYLKMHISVVSGHTFIYFL